MHRQSSIAEVSKALRITEEAVRKAILSGLFLTTVYEDDEESFLDVAECSWAWLHYVTYLGRHTPVTPADIVNATQYVIKLRLDIINENSYFSGIHMLQYVTSAKDETWMQRWLPFIIVGVVVSVLVMSVLYS